MCLLGSMVLGGVVLVTGCKRAAPPAPPPPGVSVSRPVRREVTKWDEYSGYLAAPDMVNLEARVGGYIEQARFEEGALVHKGDVLFIIDERPFKADLDSKKADVAKAEALVRQAAVHLTRVAEVVKARAVSQDDYDSAKAASEQAQAALQAAKAAEETSRLNLDWTRVTAPITGRISRKVVTVGNLVVGGSGPAPATLLTTIVSVDPIWCYVNVPERLYLSYRPLLAGGGGQSASRATMTCLLQLEDETGFPHRGVVDFVDNRVDQATGTIQLRGSFPNPEGALTPGLFARMRLPGSPPRPALLIPGTGIGTDQNERYVLIVGDDDVVQRRMVTLGGQFGHMQAIAEGLQGDERVIVDGLQMARAGGKVTPHEVPIPPQWIEALNGAATAPAASQPASTQTSALGGAE
jgi:RND family efflux transporter MFP subunit